MQTRDHTALESGYSWGAAPGGGRVTLNYAMPDVLPDYVRAMQGAPEAFHDSFTALSGAAAATFRAALDAIELVANVTFVETPWQAAQIVAGSYDFSTWSQYSGSAAFAYFPSTSPLGGDVFFDHAYADNLLTALHELGHALGLDHPFDGPVTLEDAVDHKKYTVMSYQYAGWDEYDLTGLGPLDIAALRVLYGQFDMGALRDFDGNDLGAAGDWMVSGAADVQGDGDLEVIAFNATIGRWATLGPDGRGGFDFADHGEGGDTRVVGIYIDPLVESGVVQRFSDHDSQRRFQHDLQTDNLQIVLGSGDYDGDGVHELWFRTTDQTAYLRALMHDDGNIRYANYMSEEQMKTYMTSNGYEPWSDHDDFIFV